MKLFQYYFDNIGRWTAQLNIDIDAAHLVDDSESSNSQGYPLSGDEELLSEPESEAAEEGAAAEGAKSESGLGGHTVPAPGSPLADTGLFSVAVNSPFQPAQLGAANPLSSPGSSSI